MSDIQPILTKYLMGEATPAEAEQVESWISASPGNKAEFAEQWKLTQLVSSNQSFQLPDMAQEWQATAARLKPVNSIGFKGSVNWTSLVKYLSMVTVATTVVVLVVTKPFSNKMPANIVKQSADTVLSDTLAGGTVITLNKNSSISYASGRLKQQPVAITGNAFIRTAANNNDSIRFTAGSLNVMAVQGEIFVQYDSLKQVACVGVHKGSAILKTEITRVVLAEGEAIQFAEQQREISKLEQFNVNAYSYATRIFDFHDASLKEVVLQLRETFSMQIRLAADANIADCKITARFDNKSLNEILDVIAFTLNIHYHYASADLVVLSGKGCE